MRRRLSPSRLVRTPGLGRLPFGAPGIGVLIQFTKTLALCGSSPKIRIRISRSFGGDTLAQKRILLAVADSNFKAPVGKLVQRTDEWAATVRANQPPALSRDQAAAKAQSRRQMDAPAVGR